MAILYVTVAPSAYRAASGNQEEATLAVSVTDANGVGTSGNAPALNFQVDTMITQNSSSVKIKSAAGVFGAYTLTIVSGSKWAKGVYILLIKVASGADKGQALATLSIP